MIAEIAKSLGTPLLPWQRHVADVAGEILPDGSYAYQVVVITVPRQTGKTTLIRAIGTLRALLGRDVFYTAQTGKDARARWLDLVKILRTHPALAPPRTTIALRGGSEHVGFPGGGVFQVFAPTPESLHGYTPPTVVIDEAFAQSAAAGELLMGAIEPAQQTITDRQLIIVSTMGTAESTFLHDWIERAVEGTPRVAAFVWSCGEDQSPYDLDDIAAFHPGVGQVLNGKLMAAGDVLAAADRMSRAEYERAYGNRRTVTTDALIEPDTVKAVTADLAPPTDLRSVTLAYDVAAHRAAATIIAIWTDPTTGLRAGKIVRAERGVGWLADAVVDLDTTWRPARVVAIGSGPVLDVTDDITDAGVVVDVLGERDYAAACGAFITDIGDKAFAVLDDGGRILTAVTGLVPRPASVDGIAFSRRHSVGDSSAGVALVAGLYRHRDQGIPITRFSA